MFPKNLDLKKIIIILFVACIALGIWLRVDHMLFIDAQYMITDLNRDLLVGYHIAQFGEFTLLGPDSTSGLPLYNSPLFYVLTALTGIIFGFTTIGINIGNIVYQLIAVGLLFFATRNLFNTRAAIIASALMLILDVFITQSGFFWQPHLMQVVYMLALYILSVGYVKKDDRYVYLSIFVFAASIATHYPSILVLPVFGVAVWMVLLSKHARLTSYVYTALFGILSMAIVFCSAIFYRFFVMQPGSLSAVQLPEFSITYYAATALYRTQYLISYYLPKADTALLQYIALGILCGGGIWYLRTAISKTERWAFILLVAAVLAVLFGVTVTYFPYESFVAYPLRYYTPIFIPLTMLIGVVVAALWSKGTTPYRLLCGVICAALLYFGGNYSGVPIEHPHPRSQHSEVQLLLNDKAPIEAINEAFISAMERHGLEHRFDVVTFDGIDASFANVRANDMIWFPLEIATGKHLVTLDDDYLRSYRPLGEIDHILVRCRNVTQERCLFRIENELPSPYGDFKVIVEQLATHPDPAYILRQ